MGLIDYSQFLHLSLEPANLSFCENVNFFYDFLRNCSQIHFPNLANSFIETEWEQSKKSHITYLIHYIDT